MIEGLDIPEGLEHMLGRFVDEMVKDAGPLAALEGAELADHVHAMRGKCAMFGENFLYRVLLDLEMDPKADREALRAQALDRVEALRAYFQSL